MVLKYNGAISDPQPLPGGTGQGSLLGMLIFIIELSDAGMPVPPQITSSGTADVISRDSPLSAVSDTEIRLKYIDDQTQGEVLRLDTVLDLNYEKSGPRLYNDRPGHVLPPEKTLHSGLSQ